jgi:deoxycytidylate deaminase
MEDGSFVTGENWCRNPQTTCPREEQGYASGEGYHLCRDICDQAGHAEEIAAMSMLGRPGHTAYLYGHTYACDRCKEALRAAGVRQLILEDGSDESLL